MKKKFISIAKKAMVWTMAASMLVATPLTASAQGLSDVYKIEDQWGNSIDENGNHLPDGEYHGGNSVTGTVTNTNTNTKALEQIDGIEYILIDQQDIEHNYDPDDSAKNEMVVSVSAYNEKNEKISDDSKWQDRYTWQSTDTAVVAVELQKKQTLEGESADTRTMKLKIKGGGEADVIVSLYDKNGKQHMNSIHVTVTQDAEYIGFNDAWIDADAIAGDSLVLSDYLDVRPKGHTDKITFAVVGYSTSKAKPTLKNGVLTLNKNSKDTDTVDIIAIGKKTRSDVKTLKIQPRTAANPKKSNFIVGTQKTEVAHNKTFTWTFDNDKTTVDCEVVLGPEGCTDRIVSWTSKNSDIVEVVTSERSDKNPKNKIVTLKTTTAGTTSVTAKTSSGKSIVLKVKVQPELESIKLEPVATAYAGQTLQLQVTQKYKYDNFTNPNLKLTWKILNNSKVKKFASLKAGVLTVKPDVTKAKDPVQVQVSASGQSDKMDINLQQVSITSITVHRSTVGPKEDLTAGGNKLSVQNNKKNDPINVKVKTTETFELEAKGEIVNVAKDGTETTKNMAEVLGWSVKNAKVAKVRKSGTTGSVEGVKKGSTAITVNSVVNKGTEAKPNYKAIKVTLNINVTQPSKTIDISKSISAIGNKKQTIKFKAVLEKGASTKDNGKDILWTVEKVAVDNSQREVKTDLIKKGQWKYKKDTPYKVGDEVIIRATIVETGVSKSIRMPIVEPSKKPVITIAQGSNNIAIKKNKCTLDAKILDNDPTKYNDFVITPTIDGKTPTVAVTYTLNKEGYIRIEYNKDGTATIKPVYKGTVKLTPVTADGVKGSTVTITVKNVDWEHGSTVYSIE